MHFNPLYTGRSVGISNILEYYRSLYVMGRALLSKLSCKQTSLVHFNPLYTGRLFHCYMMDKSICHFRGVGYILSLSFYF